MSSRHTNLDVHTFDATFRGRPAQFKMTSVIGHVLSIDFPGAAPPVATVAKHSVPRLQVNSEYSLQATRLRCRCLPTPQPSTSRGTRPTRARSSTPPPSSARPTPRRGCAATCRARPRAQTIWCCGWTATERARTSASVRGRAAGSGSAVAQRGAAGAMDWLACFWRALAPRCPTRRCRRSDGQHGAVDEPRGRPAGIPRPLLRWASRLPCRRGSAPAPGSALLAKGREPPPCAVPCAPPPQPSALPRSGRPWLRWWSRIGQRRWRWMHGRSWT